MALPTTYESRALVLKRLRDLSHKLGYEEVQGALSCVYSLRQDQHGIMETCGHQRMTEHRLGANGREYGRAAAAFTHQWMRHHGKDVSSYFSPSPKSWNYPSLITNFSYLEAHSEKVPVLNLPRRIPNAKRYFKRLAKKGLVEIAGHPRSSRFRCLPGCDSTEFDEAVLDRVLDSFYSPTRERYEKVWTFLRGRGWTSIKELALGLDLSPQDAANAIKAWAGRGYIELTRNIDPYKVGLTGEGRFLNRDFLCPLYDAITQRKGLAKMERYAKLLLTGL